MWIEGDVAVMMRRGREKGSTGNAICSFWIWGVGSYPKISAAFPNVLVCLLAPINRFVLLCTAYSHTRRMCGRGCWFGEVTSPFVGRRIQVAYPADLFAQNLRL